MTPFETIQSTQLNNHRRIKSEVFRVGSTESYEGSEDKATVMINLLTRWSASHPLPLFVEENTAGTP